MKQHNNDTEEKFSKNQEKPVKHQNEVREGKAESSILHDKEKKDKNSYPRKTQQDKQYDNQDEFIDTGDQ